MKEGYTGNILYIYDLIMKKGFTGNILYMHNLIMKEGFTGNILYIIRRDILGVLQWNL